MHPEAYEFVADAVTDLSPFVRVVEFGSLDINGSVRPLFDGCDYLGVDMVTGPGVDVQADAADWVPSEPVDCVVCCEVFEHVANWPGLIESAANALRPGGALIVTCAGPGRGPHSAADGNALRDGEHYANVSTEDLTAALEERFTGLRVEQVGLDVRAVARRQ